MQYQKSDCRESTRHYYTFRDYAFLSASVGGNDLSQMVVLGSFIVYTQKVLP